MKQQQKRGSVDTLGSLVDPEASAPKTVLGAFYSWTYWNYWINGFRPPSNDAMASLSQLIQVPLRPLDTNWGTRELFYWDQVECVSPPGRGGPERPPSGPPLAPPGPSGLWAH